MEKIYNVFGKEITGIKRELQKEEYGTLGLDGLYHPNWTPENEFVDGNGFDKTHCEPNGFYKMEITLPKGTMLLRYGNTTGRLTAPIGTPYELLGLPWKIETLEYHEYQVIAKTLVVRGVVSPMFASGGGGVQYFHPCSITEEIIAGRIKEVHSWRKVKNAHV